MSDAPLVDPSIDPLSDPCTHAEQHLQEYLDGLLTTTVTATVEAHLATCAHCAQAYAFEQRFRSYVRFCCGGTGSETRCREEFREQLVRRCRDVGIT